MIVENDVNLQDLVDMLNEGYSVKSIAEHFHTSGRRISRIMEKYINVHYEEREAGYVKGK